MYIRSKRIKGHTYFYLVKSERHGKKVTQKFIGYIGKGNGGKSTKGKRLQLARAARKYKSVEEVARTASMRGEPERPLVVLTEIAKSYEQKMVPLNSIEYDVAGRMFEKPDVSLRAIQEKLAALARGEKLPPIIVDQKGAVVDGQHRAIAYQIVGKKNIPAYVADGADVSSFDNLATRLGKHGRSLEEYLGVFSKEQLTDFYNQATKK